MPQVVSLCGQLPVDGSQVVEDVHLLRLVEHRANTLPGIAGDLTRLGLAVDRLERPGGEETGRRPLRVAQIEDADAVVGRRVVQRVERGSVPHNAVERADNAVDAPTD